MSQQNARKCYPAGGMLKEAEPGGEGWAGARCLLTGAVCRPRVGMRASSI